MKPRATVREEGGRLVLDDPDAVALFRAVAKANCRTTAEGQRDRLAHFVERVRALGRSPATTVIVLANVDDRFGGTLAELLMPSEDWDALRARGQTPFARGLAERRGIEGFVGAVDAEAAAKLRAMRELAVVIVDHGAVEVLAVSALVDGAP